MLVSCVRESLYSRKMLGKMLCPQVREGRELTFRLRDVFSLRAQLKVKIKLDKAYYTCTFCMLFPNF